MARFDEALNRLFNRIFVCKNCKTKIRTDSSKIRAGRVVCKNCGKKRFRPKRKK